MSDVFKEKIDATTSGPVPTKEDVNPLNFIDGKNSEEIVNEASSILREIPTVAPNLSEPAFPYNPPPLPALLPNYAIDSIDAIAEIGRQAALDVIKNLTINGQQPSINGLNVSFEIEKEKTASEVFALQNLRDQNTATLFDFQPFRREFEQPATINEETPNPNILQTTETSRVQRPPQEIAPTQDTSNITQIQNNTTLIQNELEGIQQDGNLKNSEITEIDLKLIEPKDPEEEQKIFNETQSAEEKQSTKQVGDSSYEHGSNIVVLLKRADGQRKIITVLDDKYAGVIEGGTPTAFLPPTDSYYVAGDDSEHPWKIELRRNNSGSYEFRVNLNSNLYSSLGSFSSVVVSGLGVWNGAGVGFILLNGSVSNGICSFANVVGPTILSQRISFSGKNQTAFSTKLGYIYSSGSGTLSVIQNAHHDFTLIETCVDGKPAIYPIAT